MSLFSSTNATNGNAPPKRSIFNKPAWSQSQDHGDSTDLFHRSKQSYVEIAAEEERKRRRKLARKLKESQRSERVSPPRGKRRRISNSSDDDSDGSGSNSSSGESLTENREVAKEKPRRKSPADQPTSTNGEESSMSLLRNYEDTVAKGTSMKGQKSTASHIIDLDDQDETPPPAIDDDIEITMAPRPPPAPEPPEDDDFPVSDDEFAELARTARERARRKALEDELESSLTPQAGHMNRIDASNRRPQSVNQATPPPDPVVDILITSRIEDTQPLIVNRRTGQRLKDVRLAWCSRQGFPQEMTDAVFLTWRGKRLFDVTTCKSLGFGVDDGGNILMKGQKDILGEESRRIHMEAMTNEILEDYRNDRMRGVSEERNKTEHEDQRRQEAEEKAREIQVRIIVKARGLSDFKLIVKPVWFSSAGHVFRRRVLITFPVN